MQKIQVIRVSLNKLPSFQILIYYSQTFEFTWSISDFRILSRNAENFVHRCYLYWSN